MSNTVPPIKRTFSEVVWYASIALIVISSFFLVYLLYISYFVMGIKLAHGTDSTDQGMNLISVVYFLANTLVALIASFSIVFAKQQIKHAEESRTASVYMELEKRYNEENIQYSYRKIVAISQSYGIDKRENESLGQHADRILMGYHEMHVSLLRHNAGDNTEYRRTLSILFFLEYISVLVERRYLKENDLFEFMAGGLILTEDVLKDHIRWIRGEDEFVFANALHLMKRARFARRPGSMKAFNEGYFRIAKAPKRSTPDPSGRPSAPGPS